ncbi:flagellar basal body L-ring protein FlgH [Roseateles amylovorans]|uniref:Flagellar L-ring protein n=1 Tax=Roseateles amylovorans TaxID=2978473 RepID=A0ABY6B2C3_9BURK|nr:flagellar basal body L-ring protein FlgH [Roseateles amylovorans]UXH79543.1 flagellar basal body L-ring protein FlgH [Roseateles amylovorans]
MSDLNHTAGPAAGHAASDASRNAIQHAAPNVPHRDALTRSAAALLVLLATGCASREPILVQDPIHVMPPPEAAYVERVNNGAIYQPQMSAASLFTTERRARQVGDSLKVAISESLNANQKSKTDTSRDNKLTVKGPGGSSPIGLIDKLLKADASAGGSDAYKGSGDTEASSSITGQMAVSVINVLPNGHLVVAGERSVAMNGGMNTLRFSGIVNPQDIRIGNQVQSADVVNARMELVGRGEVSDAARRSWLQRVLTSSLAIW